ncbi:MAG: hypothetical protein QOD77_191 [Thermoplasmata archaeon]|jgi:hypothetical protein|nr:hypothetical protein [Thermoplasmata archaeon]
MRGLLGLLAVAVLMAGCLADQPLPGEACVRPGQRATVTEVGESSLRVQLDGGEPAVLHLSGARLLRREHDGSCPPTTLESVGVGQTVSFDVDAWAESYPMQGWPEVVVVESRTS